MSNILTILNNGQEIPIPAIKGEPGKDGNPGADGKDGISPHIGSNGNWFIGDDDTGVSAGGGGGSTGGGGGKLELLMDVTTEEEVTYIYQSFDPVSLSELLIYADVVCPAEITNTVTMGVWPVLNATNIESVWQHGGISIPTVGNVLTNTPGAKRSASERIQFGDNCAICWAAVHNTNSSGHPSVVEGDFSKITSIRYATQNMTNNFGVGTRVRIWGVKA